MTVLKQKTLSYFKYVHFQEQLGAFEKQVDGSEQVEKEGSGDIIDTTSVVSGEEDILTDGSGVSIDDEEVKGSGIASRLSF